MSALTRQEGGGHYKGLAIQPIEYIHANGIPFAEGSVIKYVSRWRAKGGIADLKKARHFLDLLIELETKAQPVSCDTLTPQSTGADHDSASPVQTTRRSDAPRAEDRGPGLEAS